MKSLLSPGAILWGLLHIILILAGLLIDNLEQSVDYFGKDLAEGLGGSLVATGMAGLVLFIYVHHNDKVSAKFDALDVAGIKNIFRKRSSSIKDEYDKRLVDARRIDVVGWGLSHFLQDYGSQFPEWAARGRVRILLIDPDFPTKKSSIADLRDGEENRTTGDIRRQVEAFQAFLTANGLAANPSFEVRMMKSIPAINMLRADDEIFWGPYLMGQQSRNTPTLLVGRGGFLFEALKDHFEELWARSV